VCCIIISIKDVIFCGTSIAAMMRFKAVLHDDATVTIPTIHLFDDIAHVVIMDDCGEEAVSLKQLMLENPPALSVATAIGIGLGNFLAGFHNWGLDRQASNHDFFDTNQQGRAISGFVTYGRIISTITGKDDLPALSNPLLDIPTSKIDIISKISSDRIHAINTSHETLTMGDFWPGNIMVRFSPNQNDGPPSLERIYILDWEVAKPGLAGLDIGQFCAEMHLLRRFNPTCEESVTAALNAFLESYRKGFEVDAELAKVAAVHVGAHLICWTPRIPWGSNELTREVVKEGIEYLVEGYTGTQDWLKRSLIRPLL
jgi:5-methylthioribose kinase